MFIGALNAVLKSNVLGTAAGIFMLMCLRPLWTSAMCRRHSATKRATPPAAAVFELRFSEAFFPREGNSDVFLVQAEPGMVSRSACSGHGRCARRRRA